MNLRHSLQQYNSKCHTCGRSYDINDNIITHQYIYYITKANDFNEKIILNKTCKECNRYSKIQLFIKYNFLQSVLLSLKELINDDFKQTGIKAITQLYIDYIYYQDIKIYQDIDNTLTTNISLSHKEYLEICDVIKLYKQQKRGISWTFSVQI